jgi:hypothetical protein
VPQLPIAETVVQLVYEALEVGHVRQRRVL